MLENKIVLITGAAGGIGAATAARLAARGAVPVLADVDEDALRSTAASLPGQPLTVSVDVTDMASCRSAVAAALKRHDRLDAVWANAGISEFAPLELMDDAAWRRVIEVNVLGAFNIIKAALPPVIDSRGYVAITASGASWAHSPGHSAYAASKAAVEALGNSLRVELADRGVDVGVFHPQWINTVMVTQKQEHNDAFNVFFESLPAPLRTITPVEEMADVLVDAFARRATRVVYPRFSWLLYALRALLPTRPLTVTTRKVAPEIRRAYARQIPQDTNPVAPAGTTM
jgi:NAD(P)-dependent dehydrogenase (short-subunit alcohol dehydrogenase family)